MKRQLPLALLVTAITTGISLTLVQVGQAQEPPAQAKQCFMQLNLTYGQKIRLMGIRIQEGLSNQQKLTAALNVLKPQQRQQYNQCVAQAQRGST